MAILTANDFAQQIIAQLRVLEPNASAEVGTPERKIIDAVAQGLADNQVDLTGLTGALDIDSKFGTNLDQFTALFGYGRQKATPATGYVVFSRNTPAPANINIATGVIIQSNNTTLQVQYITTGGGTIAQGATTSSPVPVQCVTTGTVGNVPVNTLTKPVGTNVPAGITAVTNPTPITGGNDPESDEAFKVRFKNTVFRNLAGCPDQYLALAVSTTFTTKANVIGPVSTYLEYIQVPSYDDAGYLNSVLTGGQATVGGIQGQWTTALSAIPYAQDIYTSLSPFVSNGPSGANQYFYRPGSDFNFNYPPQIVGDAAREGQSNAAKAPNWTFLNVYNPSSGTTPSSGLLAATPGGILLAEYSYLSAASRNSLQRNVLNAVDVFVNGSNPTQGSCVFLPGAQQFSAAPTAPLYIENFRRDGQPAKRPHPGNFFTPLLQSPLESIPATITVGTTNYYLGIHYWLVHDVGPLQGSVRSRDGIEWSNYLGADIGGQTIDGTGTQITPGDLAPYTTTGNTINNLAAQTTVEVDNYTFDSNIITLQATYDRTKQVTTDVLVHTAKTRYFKLDVTVMYSANANYAVVQAAIQASLQAWMNNQFFGSVIQMSDLLDVIHNVNGVDNVRWTNDLPNAPNLMRVIECDVNGNPLHLPTVDRILGGSGSVHEIQRLYIPGGQYNTSTNFGVNDSFQLQWNDTILSDTFTTNAINFDSLSAANIQAAIQAHAPAGLYSGITVAADVSLVPNPLYPLVSFQLQYASTGTPFLPTVVNASIAQSPYAYDSDFFLRDDELASLPTGMASGDTVPGVIIRPRAQNTFVRPGIG